ncbi:MAG: sulfatase-like hydrolase/transferase [Notoacmeibacter sp.]|nr:sulfatase-like hydrolase/transferase [Notoacmeibacter sp.]
MSRAIRNILFVMYDQLRFDYLGCAGHPSLKTPNFDRLAARGVRFSRCYVQSPVCGASRMSFYTGRYVQSHGAQWNNFPLKVGEMTLGDHLRKLDMECWLVGKTHMKADEEGMDRLGIARDGMIGARVSECGFDIHVRDDGLWAEGPGGFYDTRRSPYNEYLNAKGYEGRNPWHDHANSGIAGDDAIASGWFMRNAGLPANIRAEDSETPWLTDRAIEFVSQRWNSSSPWLCHLSYIKPHWPYIVPAPYHAMYGPHDIPQPIRNEDERANPHPVFGSFMASAVSRAFSRDEVRRAAIPAYMGLIAQCDAELGRLMDLLERAGRMDDTMIVLTSDHGDYLGDHWMGEKDLFHEPSVKVPLIICDPSPEADATRNTICDELVEAIDLTATFIEAAGGEVPNHIVEGRSLMPFLHGTPPHEWREYAISEYDYSATPHCRALGVEPGRARLFMVADKRWKFMHAEGFDRPMLFDMLEDPNELRDLGTDPAHEATRQLMYARLGEWGRRNSQRTTRSDAEIGEYRLQSGDKGVILGAWDVGDVDTRDASRYLGKAGKRHVPMDEPDA